MAVYVEIQDNQKEITKIAERAGKYLAAEHNISIDPVMAIPTIAYVFFREMILFVNENKSAGHDYSIDFLKLAEIGVSHRMNEEGEKEGNYVPFITPGQEMKLLVKDDGETEE